MIKNKESQEDFVIAYMEAYIEGLTLSELAEKLERSTSVVTARISRLRKAGVELPKLHKLGEINVPELNKIIQNKLRRTDTQSVVVRPPKIDSITPPNKDGSWTPQPIVPGHPGYGKAS